MSESLPVWIAFIGVAAIVLGALRGAMLRSPGHVARGRKYAEPAVPPAPAARATARTAVPRHRSDVGTVRGAAQPGLAR